jgi:hypothetical protein
MIVVDTSIVLIVVVVVVVMEPNGRDNRNARGIYKVSIACRLVVIRIIRVIVIVAVVQIHPHIYIVIVIVVVKALIGKKGIPMTCRRRCCHGVFVQDRVIIG